MAVTVVAECGINHGGNVEQALRMVVEARRAHCDAVKFQSYRTADFLPPGHPDWEMFAAAEIHEHLPVLKDEAGKQGLLFGATPTSVAGVHELAELHVDFLKNGSDFLLRHDVIRAMAETGIATVLSAGMAYADEIRAAVREFQSVRGHGHLTVLHCTSQYPCPDRDANLLKLVNLPAVAVGFSDHTRGHTAAVAAVALGASMLEKHITWSKDADGPDHDWSCDLTELREYVRQVRRCEMMLGSADLKPTAEELRVRDRWRVREGTVRAA